MWNEVRAERVRRGLLERCSAPLGTTELLSEALALVAEAVPVEATCWASFDPATTMITSTVARSLDGDPAAFERFLTLEYAEAEPMAFRALHASRRSVAVIGDAELEHDEHVERRRHEHLAPMGIAHELRLVFAMDGAAWGGAGLLRARGRGFSEEERAFLERLAPTLAAGVRSSLVRNTALQGPAPDGPAVLVFEKAELRDATPAARTWLDAFAALDRGGLGLPAVIRAVERVASGGATLAQRVHLDGVGHLVLRGAPVGPGRAVVTIERARPSEIVALVGAALGLTPRERDVVAYVLRGLATKDIAQRLYLSPYTVQDHLKAIFAKANVRSRRELVADVFFGFYAPRVGEPVGGDGFFEGG